MSSIQDNIRNKVKYILEKEKDEHVLRQLNEDLTAYQLQLSRESNVYDQLRPDFTDQEVEKINDAFERAKNPKNLVSHGEVMEKLWKKVEQYSGKNGQNSA